MATPVYVTVTMRVQMPGEYERMGLHTFLDTHITDPELGVRLIRVDDVRAVEETPAEETT